MSTRLRTGILAYCSLLLVACSGTGALRAAYPFPTQMPPANELEEQYQKIDHDLSPLPAYRFKIRIPNEWKTLDTYLKQEPRVNGMADVAVFRQSGAWIHDALAPIEGEISVSVVNVSGSTLPPAEWLKKVLKKNAKGFTIIQSRILPARNENGSDILMTYTVDKETFVSRMMAFRSGNNMFVITGSDTAASYKDNAEAFNVAISTFRLKEIEEKKPQE